MTLYHDSLFNPRQPTAIFSNASLSPTNSSASTVGNIKMKLAIIDCLTNGTNTYTISSSVNTNVLKQELKKLQKILQKHPKRTDIKLRILEIQKQIKEEHKNAKQRV